MGKDNQMAFRNNAGINRKINSEINPVNEDWANKYCECCQSSSP